MSSLFQCNRIILTRSRIGSFCRPWFNFAIQWSFSGVWRRRHPILWHRSLRFPRWRHRSLWWRRIAFWFKTATAKLKTQQENIWQFTLLSSGYLQNLINFIPFISTTLHNFGNMFRSGWWRHILWRSGCGLRQQTQESRVQLKIQDFLSDFCPVCFLSWWASNPTSAAAFSDQNRKADSTRLCEVNYLLAQSRFRTVSFDVTKQKWQRVNSMLTVWFPGF